MALTYVKASGIDITGNYTVNSIDASANVSAGNVKTDNLLYANGTAWSLGGSYSNTNVQAYLPTYTGNVSANYFIGNGSTLTSLTGSNVIGYVPNANIANSATIADTVTTAAQPNITSVGTLSSLTVSGLITATGTGIKTSNIQDSTGTITITTKYGNVAGDAGIYGNLTVGTSGAGNVTATYFIGNGSQLTGLPASYSNTNVAAYLPTYTGNVSANYFIGNGSTLTNITGSNVTGYVPNANLANTATSATTAGTITTNAQPNITSVGTLTGLVVSGDATITGNLTVSGNTEYTNVTNLYVKDPIIEMGGGANGAPLSSNDGKDRGTLLHYYTTGTVDAFMGWDNSNGEFGFGSNVSISNEVVTFNSFGNIRAGYFIGNGSTLTNITGSNVSGNVSYAITSNYANTANSVSGSNVSGNVSDAIHAYYADTANSVAGANVTGQVGNSLISGTVYTNAQPNITSVGTLSNLSVTSNVTAGNILSDNLLYANGTAWTFGGTPGGSNTYVQFNDGSSFGGNAGLTFDKSTTRLTTNNFTVSTSANLGNVGNITITGGTANYVLTTDGTGNLNWAAQSGTGTAITVDNFTGNGVQTDFTLSASPSSVNNILVNYNGAFISRNSYSIVGSTLSFGSAPANNSIIEVSTLSGLGAGSATFNTRNYTGNGVQNTFTVTSGVTESTVLVAENGILQVPTTDYTVSGANLIFTSAPASNVAIQIRELGVAVASGGSSAITWNIASSNATMSASNGYFVDTSGGAKTMTLPSSATLGDTIRINDLAGSFSTNNLTVARNGHKIQGNTTDLLVNVDQSSFGLVYSNSTYGWKILEL
jgi:hypothetical protein